MAISEFKVNHKYQTVIGELSKSWNTSGNRREDAWRQGVS